LEYPQIAAHAIAALAASQIVTYCDAISLSEGEDLKGAKACGKITIIDYQALAQPQVVAITRHPLCGCAF
jgi:phosphatidylserine decarboxylase